MRTLQRVVGMVVIELLAAELHDVSVAPEVLGVARTALGAVDTRNSAVETAVLPDIGRDFLVTVEAQGGLATAVAAVVALRAVLFELGVRRRQFAGHEQSLRVHGLSLPCRDECAQQSRYQQ